MQQKRFLNYTTYLGLYKIKGNIPVINNVHPLNSYSKEAKKKNILSVEHGILERAESDPPYSQKTLETWSWKAPRYVLLGPRDKEGAKIAQEKETSRGRGRHVTGWPEERQGKLRRIEGRKLKEHVLKRERC